MRLRITFAKTEAMQYTSHLDLHRAWERTLRRARLPLAYSQGYHPHSRINLASALPLGFTSSAEVVDVWLDEQIPVAAVESALQKAAPPGIQLLKIKEIDDHTPTLQKVLQAAEYVITFLEPASDLENRLQDLLAAEEIQRERRGKAYDLRPLVLELKRMPDDEQGHACAFTRLAAQEGATGRPEEVVLELGYHPEEIRVQRTGLIFAEDGS